MNEKRKRGSNYTTAEKDMLLDIIKKYLHIIENKETNRKMVIKKRAAWDTVCTQFNAVAVSGNRTWQQLRHFYDNWKQKSKTNVSKANSLQYDENAKESLTKDIEKKADTDKKEVNLNGGTCISTITDKDAQILATVAPQIQPLPDPLDVATIFVDEQNSQPCTCTSNTDDDQEDTTYQSNKPQIESPDIRGRVKLKKKKGSNIREQYLRIKLRNAKLKNKYLISKHKMEIMEYRVKIEILKLRLNKLRNTKK